VIGTTRPHHYLPAVGGMTEILKLHTGLKPDTNDTNTRHFFRCKIAGNNTTSNLGLLAFGLLGFCVLVSLWQSIRAQLGRRDRLMQGMGFAASMAILAVLIHSFVDFNLHIPANAATFMVILALGWISRFSGRIN
jgi:hypothetical protein